MNNQTASYIPDTLEEIKISVEHLSDNQQKIEIHLAGMQVILQQVVETQKLQAENTQRISLLEQKSAWDDNQVKQLGQDNKSAIESLHIKLDSEIKTRKEEFDNYIKNTRDSFRWVTGLLWSVVIVAGGYMITHLHWNK